MDASKTEALEAMVRALRVLKQAKNQGVDVKPYQARMKEAYRLFEAGDTQGVSVQMEQIIAEVRGSVKPHSRVGSAHEAKRYRRPRNGRDGA
jgi:hypothetical protein